MTHWAHQYVGKPWARGARGPDAYDCLGALLAFYRAYHGTVMLDDAAQYGTTADAIQAIEHERSRWTQLARPAPGAVVVMGRRRVPSHVGFVIADDCLRCLHCLQPATGKTGSLSGVVSQRLMELPLYGWGLVQYYSRAA